MERRKFTREFKLEAVRLIKDRGVSPAQITSAGAAGTDRRVRHHARDDESPGSFNLRDEPRDACRQAPASDDGNGQLPVFSTVSIF
jgi:hypothetical protein